MDDPFVIYENPAYPFYFVESTAPNNVDDPQKANASTPRYGFSPVSNIQAAIRNIADRLMGSGADHDYANLVVMVHGYNEPEENVWKFYFSAAKTVHRDLVDNHGKPVRQNIVCIGYRWPSEKICSGPRRGMLQALPWFPSILATFSVLYVLLYSLPPTLERLFGIDITTFLLNNIDNDPIKNILSAAIAHKYDRVPEILAAIAVAFVSITFFALLLRLSAYYRDIYRATSYGAPDLVNLIRLIDKEIYSRYKGRPRVALSFVGHSLGALVVTNVVRILSDVFNPDAIARGATGRHMAASAAPPDQRQPWSLPNWEEVLESRETLPPSLERWKFTPPPEIGNVFYLMRLVLVSPDIPAEALSPSRANFLQSSLDRFQEAYLFSNEGDEVLRIISTAANYFSFPTRSRAHGYRLGNVAIISPDYGIAKIARPPLPCNLRVGYKKMAELDPPDVRATGPAGPPAYALHPAYAFSYVDCTDYVEYSDGRPQRRRGVLTGGYNHKRWGKIITYFDKITWLGHMALLIRYVFRIRFVDVHGGYFQKDETVLFSQTLICRLACFGIRDTCEIYGGGNVLGGRNELDNRCKEKQITFLPSYRLAFAYGRPQTDITRP